MEPALVGRAAATFAVLLGALGLVTWRQSRALESLSELEALRREVSVAQAERVELERDIQFLVSRGRVVPEARDELGMYPPATSELVLLRGVHTP
jgi:hypothetical protein